MSYIDSIKEFFTANLFFPFSNYLLNRKGILNNYRKLIRSEWYPEEQLREIQFKKMIRILEYANSRVPYYMKIFKEIGFSPNDIKQPEDIKMLPPLSRQDVIDHHLDMVDMRYRSSIQFADRSKRGPGEPIPFARFRKHKLFKNTSTGSTGTPAVFYEDGSIKSVGWANELRMRKWYGIKPGAKEMRMDRYGIRPGTKEMRMEKISTEFMAGNRVFLMRKYLWNQVVLPGVNLSDADYGICYESLRKVKPKVLWGFTSALFGLAEYIQKNGNKLSSYRPELIITSAEPLYEHERHKIERVFRCPVANMYGTREVGHVASKCPQGSFHINQESLYVETENIDGIYPDADTGEIIVTSLEIVPMPFIRYRIGDIGKIVSSDCACGRTLQVMKNLHGRTGEILITKDGRMISPLFWGRMFMDSKLAGSVKRFQIVYMKNGDLRIRLVKRDNYSNETEEHMRNYLKRNFQSEMNVHFDYVADIKPQVSGKYQIVINEANV